jgi:hypothetical protein
VPVEAEVATGDGEVGGDGQFFAGTGGKEGAVVADAEAEAAQRGAGGAAANLLKESEFALAGGGSGIGFLAAH